MKPIKVNVSKRGAHSDGLGEADEALRQVLERLQKKGLNPMQICTRLTEQGVVPPEGDHWDYDLVVALCRKLKVR